MSDILLKRINILTANFDSVQLFNIFIRNLKIEKKNSRFITFLLVIKIIRKMIL